VDLLDSMPFLNGCSANLNSRTHLHRTHLPHADGFQNARAWQLHCQGGGNEACTQGVRRGEPWPWDQGYQTVVSSMQCVMLT
jgi:hypothetical protein